MLDTQVVPFAPAQVFEVFVEDTACNTCSMPISGAEATDHAGNCAICAADLQLQREHDHAWLAAWDSIAP